MPDERKTEAELLQELDLLRRRVAELEQSQQAVEHSEKQFGELFENASVGVYRTTPDGRIIMANPALVHMLGYSSFEQLSQRNLEKEGFAPGYPRSLFKDLIEKNGRVANLESAWLRHDGTTVFVSEHGGVVRDKSGKALYYEGIVQDITERKKVEAALKESEAKYRDLVEEMSDIIYTVDAQGILTSVNKAVRTVSGHDPAEIIGRHFTSFLMPDCIPEVTVAFKRVLAGKSVTMETTALDSSAQQFHVEVSSIPVIKDGVVVGARGIIRDITERKKFELELRESREKYRELVDNINDGVYQTFSGVVYDHWIPNFHAFRAGSTEVCAVVGPTCDSFDKISLSEQLPADLQIGDCLYTENIGAYSIASSTKFNGLEGARILHRNN